MAGTDAGASSDLLDQGFKLHARTTAEIAERVDNFLARLKRRGLKFRNRPAKLEPFINVLVLEFFKLPPEQQEALMMREIPLFQAVLNGDLPSAAGPGPKVTVYEEMPAAPKGRRRKAGGG